MKKLLVLLLALPAFAQTISPYSASLSWTAPTANTDGSAITGSLTYNIYQGASGALGATPVQTGITTTSATITAGLSAGATVCFAVTAVEGGVESAQSAQACKTFPKPVPVSPTGLTVK